jgi:hypothetical protein
MDKLKQFYYKTCLKRQYDFLETGIRPGSELIFTGHLAFKDNRYLMKHPKIVIGSDRNELFEFLGKKKDTYGVTSRNWVKFCVGVTLTHFALVRVPVLFSMYFGDNQKEEE